MDFIIFLSYLIGGIIVIYFLLYVLTAQNILGLALKKSAAKIIPRADVPEYLSKFYEIKETQLVNLGFAYQFCIFTEDLVVKEYPQRYIFIYYNPQKKTYATLTSSDAADYWLPFQVAFETHFKNGKNLVTYNGLQHNLIDTLPNTILNDAYAETLEKHFLFHLQRLTENLGNEGEIKEFDPSLSDEMLLKQYDQDRENYVNQLNQKNIIYKLEKDKYGIKTLASLGIAHKMISGMNRMSTLRKKVLAQKNEDLVTADIPVEIDLANYQNSRAVLTSTIKNTSGKIFFLLVSLLLFAGVFSLIVSFGFMLILVTAVLFHETGHLLAMRLLGFRNLKMLFIPLFGAVAMGSDKGISPYKKVISYFAGPVPGIIIGFLLLFLLKQNMGGAFSLQSPSLLNLAFLLLVLNYFNLLPVMPFDGGQVFNTVIFSRFAFLRKLFYLVSILVISMLAIILHFPLLFFVAFLIGIGLFQSINQGKIIKAVKKELKTSGPITSTDVLKKVFLVLRQGPYRQYTFKKKFQLVQNVESILDTPRPSVVTVVATLIFYLFIMGAPALYLFSPGLLKGLLSGTKNSPGVVKNPCEEVARYKPEPGMLSQVTQVDFARLPAQQASENNATIFRYCLFFNHDDPSSTAIPPESAVATAIHPGTFLAKLTALYGKPDEKDNIFAYTLLEKKTGIIFHVLHVQGVSKYVGHGAANEKLIPLCYRFEALLKNISPVDCNYVYQSEFGRFAIGVSDGEPFWDTLATIDRESLQKKQTVFFTPVTVNGLELTRMLKIYRVMYAVGHDRWLTSEDSMSKIILEVTGLPTGLTKEQQLELFPVINEWLGNKEKTFFFKELKFPYAPFMQSGVYTDPEQNRLLLIQGFHYIQDEVRLVQCLAKAKPQLLTVKPGLAVDMEFVPNEFGDPGDSEKYYLYLKGNLISANPDNEADPNNSCNFVITGAVGPINTQEKINAWLEAAKFYAQFEKVPPNNAEYRLELKDEKEVKAIQQVCQEVTEGLQDIAVEGKYLIGKNSQADQLGLLVIYHRYARDIFYL